MQEELRQGEAMAALRRFNDLLESLPEDRWGEPCQARLKYAVNDGAKQQRPRLVLGTMAALPQLLSTAATAVASPAGAGQRSA